MSREPRLVERGTEETAEHGLGAGESIFRPARVRPLLRFEVGISPRIKVVPRSIYFRPCYARAILYLHNTNKTNKNN